MSITFSLTCRRTDESLNLSNSNACALLSLLGLPPHEFGDVKPEAVAGHVRTLLRVANLPAERRGACTALGAGVPGRWHEGVRGDAYVERRARDLLALFQAAQRQGCGITWG